MQNEVKKIYNTLSGGKIISGDNYVVSLKQFNSISSDRFISELRKMGINWNGNDIHFSDLLKSNFENLSINEISHIRNTNFEIVEHNSNEFEEHVGVDIQEISELPDSSDYWDDDFYKSKFSPAEIAYCVAKDNPKQSFSGIYSCKEAIIKSNNNLKWQDINIVYNENGKPIFENYNLSISHSGLYSIAIAIKIEIRNLQNILNNNKIEVSKNSVFKEKDKSKSLLNFLAFLFLYVIVFLIVTYLLYKEGFKI
jgi:phosphopantetheine--protein transferase-like protein